MLGEAAASGRGKAMSDLRLPVNDGVTGPRKDGADCDQYQADRKTHASPPFCLMNAEEKSSVTRGPRAPCQLLLRLEPRGEQLL